MYRQMRLIILASKELKGLVLCCAFPLTILPTLQSLDCQIVSYLSELNILYSLTIKRKFYNYTLSKITCIFVYLQSTVCVGLTRSIVYLKSVHLSQPLHLVCYNIHLDLTLILAIHCQQHYHLVAIITLDNACMFPVTGLSSNAL